MSPAGAVIAMPGAQVLDLIQLRLQRALRERQRYRYVTPRVTAEDEGFLIQSPCCSRNVDPQGGLIDIALLMPMACGHWRLSSRDHATSMWVERLQDQPLEVLLEALCVDSERVFWL